MTPTISADAKIRVRCPRCGATALATPSQATFGLWHADLPCGERIEAVGPRSAELRRDAIREHSLGGCTAAK